MTQKRKLRPTKTHVCKLSIVQMFALRFSRIRMDIPCKPPLHQAIERSPIISDSQENTQRFSHLLSYCRNGDWGEVVRMREHDRPPVAHTLPLKMPHVRSYSKYCVQYLALVCFLNFVSQFFVRVSKAAFILGGNRVKQWTVGRQVPDFF